MIKYILIVLIGLTTVSASSAQTWNEWFKQKKTQRKYLVRQIAALKVYLETAKKGYEIARRGLTAIGDIKDGSFQMDRTYFASLKAVNPSIQKSAKAKLILAYQGQIVSDLSKLQAWSSADQYFTEGERKQLSLLKKNLLEQSHDSLDELALVLTSGMTEMKDDERLQRIDRIYTEMQHRFAFVQTLTGEAKSLSMARAKDQHDLTVISATHQLI
jgi:hypothetical protein